MSKITSTPWPGDKDKVFREGPIWNTAVANLDCTTKLFAETFFPDAYKKAADIIVKQFENKEVEERPDFYFFPIAYLYRHAFELRLKQIISYGILYEILEDNAKLKEIMGDHKLCPLWHKARIIIEHVWPSENKKDLDNVERLIQELHKVDPCGQNFRYSRRKNSRSTMEELPESVDLTSLRKACDVLFKDLNATLSGLEDQGAE